ncbi:hypothetical protein EON63_09750 [archaeon]|nr:MAG: hypothetical protein EON63_09750 [archaeon]
MPLTMRATYPSNYLSIPLCICMLVAKQRLVNVEAEGLEASQEKRAQQDASNSNKDNVSISGSYCADGMECT